MQDGLVVSVRNVRTRVRTGVNADEQGGPQGITVDIAIRAGDRPTFGPESALHETVDYGDVLDYLIRVLPEKPHLNLLESVADDLFAFVFDKPGVVAATITITKDALAIEERSVGIELTRRNPAPRPLAGGKA